MGINATYPIKGNITSLYFLHSVIRPLKGIALVTGSYGNPSTTNQRDYWRVAVQLLKRAKVDLVILALVSAMTIQLDIHIKEKFLST